ncbi:hypothetical protein [Cupriavidus plantarum]|uniref:Uncharacterized protein n=1 Tax=Cupriavidus plantarum TaxID=942865 RepID=A0A316EYC1_9BURK|nr:hypothetical protein [Cupriavidus plantarum]PWK37717.1 hypothetical protein C7419_1011600 [Cupriavidus plantarum]REF01576.1 hypothetical protein C7418_0358 [Cupriavidus plantarum]CAG2128082.1 hypothetical protein LMG26296_01131 [Cupriavidus plantarum]SMR66739.1 hypothetical protein SAMN05421735_1625 [Cupriavidus plantarum]
MGVVAVAGAAFYLWRAANVRVAFIFLAVVVFGIAHYLYMDEQRPCSDRAWFCDFVPMRGNGFVGPLDPREACPEDVEPLTARVFQSEAANAEVHRQIARGACQKDAIRNVAKGWKAPYDPSYGTWWERLFQ